MDVRRYQFPANEVAHLSLKDPAYGFDFMIAQLYGELTIKSFLNVIAAVCLGIFAVGCTTVGSDALSTNGAGYPGDASTAKIYLYSWALPKTTFDASVTWKFKRCRVEGNSVIVEVQPTAPVVVAHAVPDQDVGWITLDATATQSFWQEHVFDVKTAAGTHLLQGFNSTATDQTGPIISNVLTAATKIVTIALGVPTGAGAPAARSACGPAVATLNALDSSKAQLAAMADPSSAAGKALVATISALQDRVDNQINIKATTLIDPGLGAIVDGKVGEFAISQEQLERAGWYPPGGLPNGWKSQYQIDVYLGFDRAQPAELACTMPCKGIAPRKLTRGALFREVAYLPIEFRWQHTALPVTADETPQTVTEVVGKLAPLPFAQFGAPRKLPLDAPLFGKADWTLTFNEFGEVTEAKWGSVATGVAMTALLSNAAGAASSIDSAQIKAAGLADSATLATQLENAKLKAIIDNANYRQQCRDLQAKGTVAECP